MHRAIALGAILVAGVGCGPAAVPSSRVAPQKTAAGPPPVPAPADAGVVEAPPPSIPSLDVIAARAGAVAPGMREVARGELSSDGPSTPRILARAEGADTCVRVAFVATPAVHASLADSRGDVLADVPSASDTALAPHGPVCVRRGDSISLHLDAPGSWRVRFVAWASP
jgi:hypothetical protein